MTNTAVPVSYSSLKQWASCPRAGYLGNYLQLQRIDQPRTGAMPFGTRVHTALELFNNSGWTVEPVKIWRKLMDREWDIAQDSGQMPWNLEKEDKLGFAILEGFWNWLEEEHVFAKWRIVHIEHKLATSIEIPLPDGRLVDIILKGKLDIVEQRLSDGAIFAGDYKTVGDLSETTISSRIAESQGPLYTILLRNQEDTSTWVAGFVLIMLRKVLRSARSNPPYYQRIELPYSNAKLDSAYRNIMAEATQVLDTIDRLDNGAHHLDVAPYRPSWQCQSCPFKNPCQEMQDGNIAGADRMLDDLYVVGDPMARYTEPSVTLESLGLAPATN